MWSAVQETQGDAYTGEMIRFEAFINHALLALLPSPNELSME